MSRSSVSCWKFLHLSAFKAQIFQNFLTAFTSEYTTVRGKDCENLLRSSAEINAGRRIYFMPNLVARQLYLN